MPVTVRGTDILFNNGTTQSTAAVVDTTAVLNATAAASVGAVGTYAFLVLWSGTAPAAGGTIAGSNMRFGGIFRDGYTGGILLSTTTSPLPSGTWRSMGKMNDFTISGNGVTLFLRIS